MSILSRKHLYRHTPNFKKTQERRLKTPSLNQKKINSHSSSLISLILNYHAIDYFS